MVTGVFDFVASDSVVRRPSVAARRPTSAPRRVGAPGAGILALQRSIGNRAVVALMRSGGDMPMVQRAKTFEPFKDGAMTKANDSLSGLTLDTLAFAGLTYPRGATKGNSVNLEKLLRNTGGGSSPGEPADFTLIKLADKNLLRARGQVNAATAMHAINGDFTAGANDTASNIFMGSARSNTDLHFNMVERPIRSAMQKRRSGDAKKYETGIKAKPPVRLTKHPDTWAWSDASLDIPGITPLPPTASRLYDPDPLMTPVSHLIGAGTTKADPLRTTWPRIIEYLVTPNYNWGPYPAWPQFLLDNVAAAQQLVDDAERIPMGDSKRPAQELIDNEKNAIAVMKAHAHQMFPETYTCTASYWLASYDPTAPWLRQTESDSYDAEA